MNRFSYLAVRGIFVLTLLALTANQSWAGGSGLNVLVVVNQASTNSVELGNYYCERRHVPPQNVLRMTNWTGGNINWTRSQFESTLRNPLLAMLAARQLTNQIDFVVLSMDIPYRVTDSTGQNGTTSALFYGFKPDDTGPVPGCPTCPASCSLPAASTNSYAFSEQSFRAAPPTTAPTNAFLATMITASDLAAAKSIVDHGVSSDGSMPPQAAYLAIPGDFRNVRYMVFDDAVFNTRVRGNYSLLLTNQESPDGLSNLLGYQTGLYGFGIQPNTFVPGALADNLTSYGGYLFEFNWYQTTLLAFLDAGASGSYGTIIEPCAYLEKFPSPHDYFYQARGFSLAESYYMSLQNPYQGLIVGEPLAAPYANSAAGQWNNLPSGALLTGTTNLSVRFASAGGTQSLQQVDLFLDGTFLRTVTNLPPAAGNLLSARVNGYTVTHPVPAGGTLPSLAAGLADDLNAVSNATQVTAFALGDRIELQSLNPAKSGTGMSLSAASYTGAAASLTTFVTASRSNFLDSTACPTRMITVSNAPLVGDWLQFDFGKTNGTHVTISVTNTAPSGTISDLTLNLFSQINSHPSLQSPDGVRAGAYFTFEPNYLLPLVQFSLTARTPGPGGRDIRVILSGSGTFVLGPAVTNKLDEIPINAYVPRNHLYLTAGVTNLLCDFPLVTTALADGYHELSAVAYDGSSVRMQTRLTQTVVVKNTPLSATIACQLGGTNIALEATLPFVVTANTNTVNSIELFSTGGSLGKVLNQSNASFSVAGTNLGPGLHPFYALVGTSDGRQYRTETKWIRLVAAEAPFRIRLVSPPLSLTWPALAGRQYTILSTTNLNNAFQIRASLTPTNSTGLWVETNASAPNRFYRVRNSP